MMTCPVRRVFWGQTTVSCVRCGCGMRCPAIRRIVSRGGVCISQVAFYPIEWLLSYEKFLHCTLVHIAELVSEVISNRSRSYCEKHKTLVYFLKIVSLMQAKFQHDWPPPHLDMGVTIHETWNAMVECKDAGLARNVGVRGRTRCHRAECMRVCV